jgi:hypothetical protein
MAASDDTDVELLLDVTGLPSQSKITEIVTSIAAGAVIVLYSASELLQEIRKWRESNRKPNPPGSVRDIRFK